MTMHDWLPLFTLLTSLLTGLLIFFLREQQVRARSFLNMTGAGLKLVFVAIMLWGSFHGRSYETRLPLLGRTDLVLRADALAMLFVGLSSLLWFLTTIYVIGYLEKSPNRSRFFGFFSICVTATVGIALAGNLPTFIVFYRSGCWPVLLGGLLGWAEWRRAGRTGKSVLPSIPPGDLLIPLAALLKRLYAIWRNTVQTSRAKELMERLASSGTGVERLRSLLSTLPATEQKLLDWTTAGAIFLLLTIALLALMVLS